MTSSGLSTTDMALLARCAWQRQQGAGETSLSEREVSTIALWTAAGSRKTTMTSL